MMGLFVLLAASAAAAPCSAPAFHQWDFWLGSWEVRDPAGALQGTNRISPAPGGCGMVEQWTNARGVPGQSFNVYDPVSRDWTQLWAGADSVIRLRGRFEQGAMRMEGSIAYYQGGPERPFRGVWTPLPDGAVKQEFFEQDPATKAWSTWFVGVYRRQP